jgi:hypothetical protein
VDAEPACPRGADGFSGFADGAVIARACGTEPVLMDVDAFIEPRRRLLGNGTLVDFHETELSSRTDVFGDIAQRLSTYAKSGVQDGHPISGRGTKTMQLLRTSTGWRISAVAWDDERPS